MKGQPRTMEQAALEMRKPLVLVDTEFSRQLSAVKYNTSEWSNLSKIVYRRTYLRSDYGKIETFEDSIRRIIRGNIKGLENTLMPGEIERLAYFMMNRKVMPAGRVLWYSGSPSHDRLGGAALCNCWGLTGDDWNNLVLAMDLLMLGGGTGMSVEHRYVSKLPRIKKEVKIVVRNTNDADFIIPDSREGWCELIRRVLEARIQGHSLLQQGSP